MKFKHIPEVSSELFTFHKDSRSFSCEESTLRANGFLGGKRIYDDACDVGFYLVSKKTGQKLLFVETRTVINNDNEITHWEYSAHCLHENPEHLLDLKLNIWND